MNDNNLRLSGEVQERLAVYLDSIDEALRNAGAPRDERRGIVDDVEAQVLAMLETGAVHVSRLEDLEAVIAELDPPASYAAAYETQEATKDSTSRTAADRQAEPSRAKLSSAALAGLFYAVPSVLLAILARATLWKVESWTETSWGATAYEMYYHCQREWLTIGLAAASLALAIVSAVMGVLAVRDIRRSAGRRRGTPLAFSEIALLPVLAIIGGMFLMHVASYLR